MKSTLCKTVIQHGQYYYRPTLLEFEEMYSSDFILMLQGKVGDKNLWQDFLTFLIPWFLWQSDKAYRPTSILKNKFTEMRFIKQKYIYPN